MNTIRNGVIKTACRARRSLVRVTLIQENSRCRSTIEKPPGERVAEKEQQFFIPKGIMGQPTCYTHPHMVPDGHLTCGITQQEYRERRETLVHKLIYELNNIHRTHVIVIPGAAKQYMSDKIPFVFRQNTDFFYLTGCMEPSAVLVMIKQEQTENFKTILFVQDKDSHAELWEGPRTGCAAAARLFAVDEARPAEAFHKFINKTLLASKPSILWYHSDCAPDPAAHASVRAALQAAGPASQRADPQRALHFMRAIKSPAEIELMKSTCEIGAQSLNMAMACTKPGVSEASIAAALEYSVCCAGAEHAAFPPVVAGGTRATHIHYVSNNQLLRDDEMLLIDTGSQRWLYNSDISRTFPVSGKFSTHHRILYELVLAVQKRLIELLGQHRPPLDQLFDSMCRLLGKHLQEEGILPRSLDGGELINRAYRLCPHHVSHYVGMDVHDTPLVGRRDPVRTGHCVTIEPGIYTRLDDETIPPEFRGVGIRIEDDVLITDGEPLVLTRAAVKEVDDIEAIVGKHAL